MKNKKPFVAILGLFVCALAIGATYATLTTEHTHTSEMSPDYLAVTTNQSFTSPSNWQTCQTVANPVTVSNNSNFSVQVRVRYDEFWRTADSTSTGTTSDLPLIDGNNVRVAVINFVNQSDWVYNNGWYEYQHSVAPGQTSNSFIESVTLNCDANLGGTNTCVTEGNTITCTRNPSSYANAQYHLNITVETSQI